jgi:hypothetical protein
MNMEKKKLKKILDDYLDFVDKQFKSKVDRRAFYKYEGKYKMHFFEAYFRQNLINISWGF